MHHFAYRDGVLCAEDVPLPEIAGAVGTPFYCYSSATIERHFEVFRAAFADQDALVCYAMKANSNQAVLATLARLGAGMDVVSEGELRRARAAGVPGDKIIFSGVGKTRAEMNLGLDEHILCFNVESEPELEALSAVASARERGRPDRHPRQPRHRRAHPRQDFDRQIGEQVRRADLPRPRSLRARPRAARPFHPRRRHAYRLADHRPRAFRQRLRAAGRFRAERSAPTGTRSTMSISAAASASPIAPTTIRRPSLEPMPTSSPATRRARLQDLSSSRAGSSSATPAC